MLLSEKIAHNRARVAERAKKASEYDAARDAAVSDWAAGAASYSEMCDRINALQDSFNS